MDWRVFIGVSCLGGMLSSKFAYIIGEKYRYGTAWVMATTIQGILLIIAGLFLQNWLFVGVIFILFASLDGLWQPSWNHVVVEQTQGKAVATTRSVVFAIFALYTTMGKQVLSFFPLPVALMIVGTVILIANIMLGKKISTL